MANQLICIIGGTGFVGKHLVSALTVSDNVTIKVATHRLQQHQNLFKHPNVELQAIDVFNPTQLQNFLHHCTVVINLVGILNETGTKQTFSRLHSQLVTAIVNAAQITGVQRFLHISALHANAHKGPSRYLYTKGEGEDTAHNVGEKFMSVTSFRPSVIFGPGDSFFNRFAGLLRFAPGVFPLACSGSRFQPVFVGDVVEAFVRSIHDTNTYGKRYNLCGPTVYTLKELVDYTARTMKRRIHIVGLNDALSQVQGHVLGMLPNSPFSYDNYLSLQLNSICEANDFAALGITPQPLENIVPTYLI